jgi:hypothetical protein
MIDTRDSRRICNTDTCPSNDSFWKSLLGNALATKLGLFHLLHRVFDTLDAKCELYWKCLVKLKSAVYTYLEDDEAALIVPLKYGMFPKSNQKYPDREIDDLRHSKRRKERYGGYLKKRIMPGATIVHNLSKWIDEFKSRTDATGRPVFSQRTIKVTVEQMKKVKHASDHPGVQMYTRIPPGPRSTHGLSKWCSDHPEFPLEKFNELLAHFVNTRMNPELTDSLSLGGTAEYNVKCIICKAHVNNNKIEANLPAQYPAISKISRASLTIPTLGCLIPNPGSLDSLQSSIVSPQSTLTMEMCSCQNISRSKTSKTKVWDKMR